MARPRLFEGETSVVSVRMDQKLLERISEMARSDRRSINQQVIFLIELAFAGIDRANARSADINHTTQSAHQN